MPVHPNISERVVSAASRAFHSKKKLVYFVGTHEEDKGRAGALMLLYLASELPGNYLIRRSILTNDLAELTFGKGLVELLGAKNVERLQKERRIKVNNSWLYLDSTSSTSQRQTPFELKGALLLPFDGMHGKRGREGEVIEAMYDKAVDRLILVSCTDNKDDAWIKEYDPEVIILNEQDPERHNRIFAIFGNHFQSKWYGPV